MNRKTRKHIWPVVLMSLTVFGVLAAVVALSVIQPEAARADGCDQISDPIAEAQCDARHRDADLDSTDSTHTHGTDDTVVVQMGSTGDAFSTGSTSASASIEVKLVIEKLPMNATAGSSIELYLEDDFAVPGSIDRDTVYFTVDAAASTEAQARVNGGGRVYAADPIEINDGDHFGGDDDWSIRVYIPDMNTSDNADGYQGPEEDEAVTLVFTKAAGIKNPSEASDAGNHSVGYSVLDSNGDGDGDDESDVNDGPFVTGLSSTTVAKIKLGDEDNVRGHELTVTGTGFNNGVTASAHVLAHARYEVAKWWETLDCAGMKTAMGSDSDNFCLHYDLNATDKTYSIATDRGSADFMALDAEMMKEYSDMVFAEHLCGTVIMDGTELGSAVVGSDDTVTVSLEVTSPTFQPGNVNYICMKDGENRQSSTDVEVFHLEPSIRVVPSTVSSGDTVNVFAQDYPFSGPVLTQLKLAGIDVTDAVENLRNQSLVNGSAAISFEVPGSVDGGPLQGTVRVDARWGSPGSDDKCNVDADSNCASEDSKITVTGSELTASVTDVLPNETITITGNGFGSQTCIDVGNIQLDGVAVQVDDESTTSCRVGDYTAVEVSNSGQFVATITVWPQDTSVGADNPTLISGNHTLDVEDSAGFVGSTTLTIAEPTISVVPDVVGPRDYVVITGTSWPVDNSDNSNSGLVTVVISDDKNARTYSVYPNNVGRFTIEHRVSKDVAIPSTNQVKGSHSDVVKIGSFRVPAATVTVTPNEAQPGDTVSLSATDMKPYAEADYVKIGGTTYNDPGANTDIDGNITIDDVLVPGLDPGTYSVIIDVDGTVAIGELDVLAEDSAAGAGAELPGALEELGDNLERVFHFNGVDKSWDFYDPRDEFAELNTLTTLVNGEPYWVLVSDGQEDVVLNNRARTLTCVGGDCWNQLVW